VRIKEVTATAVIPTAQYANLQATITVEVGEDVEAAKAEALRHIEQISQQYAEIGKALPQLHQQPDMTQANPFSINQPKELHSSVTGQSAFFDEALHRYTNQFGQTLLSGSTFCEGFCPGFDANMIVPKMEAKYNVPGQDIRDMWEAKADASRHVGDAIHKSLELYGKYKPTGLALDRDKKEAERKWSHIHDNPILNAAVASFFASRDHEDAMYEVFVVNNDAMLCGHIDRLLITGDRRCRVQDFKTNGNIQKKGSPKMLGTPFNDLENTTLNKYWLQLSFYAHILQLSGWVVEGLDIFHYTQSDDGEMEWQVHTHTPVDISAAPILTTIKQ
jgi:hypothetical protein